MDIAAFLSQTMLIERLVGVACYALSILAAYAYIDRNGWPKARRALVVYAVVLGLMGFFYVPGPDADLNRLWSQMHDWSSLPSEKFWAFARTNSTPVFLVYLRVIGFAGVDGLLPGITSFVGNLLVFSCLWDYMARLKVSNRGAALSLAFFMATAPIVGLISGVRNSLAFAIIFWCLYRELVKGRSVLLHLPLYAAAALMHSAALAFVLLRLVLLVFEKGRSRTSRLVILGLATAGVVGLAIFGGKLLPGMVRKLIGYATEGSYSYFWEYLIKGIALAFVAYSLWWWRKLALTVPQGSQTDECLGMGNLFWATVVFSVVALASGIVDYTMFSRAMIFLAPFGSLAIMNVYRLGEVCETDIRVFARILVATTLVMLLLSCARGDLCGYKFFLLG